MSAARKFNIEFVIIVLQCPVARCMPVLAFSLPRSVQPCPYIKLHTSKALCLLVLSQDLKAIKKQFALLLNCKIQQSSYIHLQSHTHDDVQLVLGTGKWRDSNSTFGLMPKLLETTSPNLLFTEFEVLGAAVMNIAVFWDIVPCALYMHLRSIKTSIHLRTTRSCISDYGIFLLLNLLF